MDSIHFHFYIFRQGHHRRRRRVRSALIYIILTLGKGTTAEGDAFEVIGAAPAGSAYEVIEMDVRADPNAKQSKSDPAVGTSDFDVATHSIKC